MPGYLSVNDISLYNEAKVYLKRKGLPDLVVKIAPEINHQRRRLCYELYAAYNNPDYLGRILFDEQGYWIYDGDDFSIDEQEHIARFIINNGEKI
jgi:hypothetical protein